MAKLKSRTPKPKSRGFAAGSLPIRIAATGNVGASTIGGVLRSVTLAGVSADSTLVIKEGGSSGTQIWPTLAVKAGTTVHVLFGGGIVYGGQLHGTLTGSGAEAGFELG